MGEIFRMNFPENDKKHDQSALMKILQVFGRLSNVDCQRVLWNGAF